MTKLRFLLLAGAVVLEVGCGLPDSFFLQPPTPTQTGAGLLNSTLVISGTTRGNDVNVVFQGYELYYKCYALNDPSLIADENYASTSNTYTDLLNAGFHRVCRGPGGGNGVVLALDTYPGSQNAPLINISQIDAGNIGNNYTITIKMGDTNPPSSFGLAPGTASGTPAFYFSYTPPAGAAPTAGWEIRRFVQANTNFSPAACSTFASNFFYTSYGFTNWNPTDADMNPTIYNVASAGININFYAVSTGTGLDGAPRFSSPVWMGYTLINILN